MTNDKNNIITVSTTENLRHDEKKTNSTVLSSEFKQKLLEQKNIYVAARTSKLQQGIANKIIENIKEFYKLKTNEEALTIIAVLFSTRGYSSKLR